jgi:hypothetical protein
MYFKKFYEQLPSRMIRLMEDGKRNSIGGSFVRFQVGLFPSAGIEWIVSAGPKEKSISRG